MTIEERINLACDLYHWIERDEKDPYVLNMYLDHHALSTFRQCEAHFVEAIINRRAPSGLKAWPLEFGSAFHKAVEYIYKTKAINEFNTQQMIDLSVGLWNEHSLDNYKEHKTYKALGGLPGFLALLSQYAIYYSGEIERLRPIATEVPFGKNKEVPLGIYIYIYDEFPGCAFKIYCYLTGRLDFLMDNGKSIGPMDHKTSGKFKENPVNTYETQEGMTGYVYASQKIIQSHFPELAAKRSLDRIWMNFIQISDEPDSTKRFKRIPIFKTPYQLEEYCDRQVRTFKKIFEVAVLGESPDWNTNACNNWWFGECIFRKIHRQGAESARDIIRNADFKIIDQWNPEVID